MSFCTKFIFLAMRNQKTKKLKIKTLLMDHCVVLKINNLILKSEAAAQEPKKLTTQGSHSFDEIRFASRK